MEAGVETRIYQVEARHKEFAAPLNVVIVVKTQLTTQAVARVLLFSSDLGLAYERVIDYYRLRCNHSAYLHPNALARDCPPRSR